MNGQYPAKHKEQPKEAAGASQMLCEAFHGGALVALTNWRGLVNVCESQHHATVCWPPETHRPSPADLSHLLTLMKFPCCILWLARFKISLCGVCTPTSIFWRAREGHLRGDIALSALSNDPTSVFTSYPEAAASFPLGLSAVGSA